MKHFSWRPFVWVLLHMLLLLSMFSPFLIITFWFMMIPTVILFMELKLPRFIIFYIIGSLALVILLNWIGFFAVLISLFLLPTSVVIGSLYKKNSSARRVLTSGSLTMLAQLLLTLFIVSLSGINITSEFQRMMNETMAVFPETMRSVITEDMQDQIIEMAIQMLPYYFICFSVLIVAVTHTFGRKILNRSGMKVQGLPPVREWKLPKSLVWYFVIALFFDFFIKFPPEHMITMILRNLIPLLTLAFSIQAISFLFFLSHTKRWNKALPIVSIAAMIFFPIIQFLLSILGVIDVAFPIRDRITNNK